MKLYTDVNCTTEFGDGPHYAIVEVTPELVARVKQIETLIEQNDLKSAAIYGGPEKWERENELRLRGDSLKVVSGLCWFTALPKYGDYVVETSAMSISGLEKLLASNGDDRCGEFLVKDGVAYLDITPDYVAEIDAEAETN